MDIMTASPAEIDSALAEIYGRYYVAVAAAASRRDVIARDDKRKAEGSRWILDSTERANAVRSWTEAEHAAAVILAETAPFDAEFTRRRGWTRAYLVQNNGGHVHSSMSCQTCYPTTQFGWLTQVSDHSEAEIVELAGEGACSVCYPSAPRIGRNRLELPADKAAREERQAAKAERDAAKAAKALLAPVKLTGRFGEWVDTLASAWRIVVENVANVKMYGYAAKPEDNDLLVAALAAKTGQGTDWVWSQVDAKVAAKIKRDSRY